MNQLSTNRQENSAAASGTNVAEKFECLYCPSTRAGERGGGNLHINFKDSGQFLAHLRQQHCTKEGGSFVCRYGSNNVCKKLPFEGVSDLDYVEHVKKFHLKEFSSSGHVTPPSLIKDNAKRHRWSLSDCSQNLAAVLNDPRKSRREMACFFTRYWGDTFVEKFEFPPLPSSIFSKISAKFFEEYVRKISRRRKLTISKNRFFDNFSVSITSSVGDIVPALFFSPKFSLLDPQCFEALFLTANLEIVPDVKRHTNMQIRREERLKPSKLLQEKLSFYLDSIEVQISRQISAQSQSFFRAMTSHDQLQTHLSQIRRAVGRTRTGLRKLDDNLASKSLRLLRLKTCRSNYEATLKKLELISTVNQTQNMVQTLLHSGDYLGALELINTTQTVLKEELHNVLCFRHLSAQLNELQLLIGKMLLEEFSHFIKKEFNIFALISTRKSAEKRKDSFSTTDETTFVTIVLSMCHIREFKFLHLFSEEICNCVKKLIRESIRQNVDLVEESGDSEIPAGTLADQMRKLDFDSWFFMFKTLIDNLMTFLSKVKVVINLILKLIDISYGKLKTDEEFAYFSQYLSADFLNRTGFDETEYANLLENIHEFLSQCCTYAQERLVRVLVARSKDEFIERLILSDFLKLYELSDQFCRFCEQKIISIDKYNNPGQVPPTNRKIFPLHSCMHAQSLKLLAKFHEDRKCKLGNILDLEHWKRAEVPHLFQDIVDTYEKTGKLRDTTISSEKDHTVNSASSKMHTKSVLIVAGEEYAVIGVGLIMVQIIAQYCQFVDRLPVYAPELLTRLNELLKIFNSRTCQLILGAGALQLVGLKTIGARNLGLASRCLQLVLYFINVLMEYFKKYLPANQHNFLRYISQTAKDFQDHVDEIFNKLLSIMEGQIAMCIKKWEIRPPVPSQCIQQFVKQLKRFHDNIVDVLPSDQLQKLLLRIHRKFKQSIRNQLIDLNITPQDVALYNLVCSDFSYYMENLKTLPCCQAVDDSMQDVLTLRTDE